MTRIRRILSGLAALALSAAGLGATALTATPASAATGCSVAYTVPSQWNTGFTANIVITNLGSPLTSWNLGYSYGGNQTLQSGWNGTWTQSGANVTVANASPGTGRSPPTAPSPSAPTSTTAAPSSRDCPDKWEASVTAAAREVEEETGWRPRGIEFVMSSQPLIGNADYPQDLYLANGAELVGEPEVDETAEVAWVPVDETPAMIARGDILGAITIIGVQHALLRRAAARVPPP